jgi:hypothetical protein
MWRFTRNDGILEDVHPRLEGINRPASGFRNFDSYRMRVKVLFAGTGLGVRRSHV